MRSFRDLSLKHKLTLVLTLTSFLVLLAAFTAAFVFERASSHAALGQDLSSLSEVVSANSTAALSFEDARSATEILSTLRLRPNVVTAGARAFAVQQVCIKSLLGPAAEPYNSIISRPVVTT